VRKLTVKNFSVIKEAELEFGKITVLIGPQSSGKSLLCKLAYFISAQLPILTVDAVASGQFWDMFEPFGIQKFTDWCPLNSFGSNFRMSLWMSIRN
jgi:ABC-type cobalamin transport system ATPase subunit